MLPDKTLAASLEKSAGGRKLLLYVYLGGTFSLVNTQEELHEDSSKNVDMHGDDSVQDTRINEFRYCMDESEIYYCDAYHPSFKLMTDEEIRMLSIYTLVNDQKEGCEPEEPEENVCTFCF